MKPKQTRKTFSDMIMKRVSEDTSDTGYLAHIIEYCDVNSIPHEQIQYLISQDLKKKLLKEGIRLNTVIGEIEDD